MAGDVAADTKAHRYHNRRLERALPGLDLLLDAFAVVDCGVAQAIACRGQAPACGTNCYQCCIQPIPATPLEILGLRMFVQQELATASAVRQSLAAGFARFLGDTANLGAACPFLHEGRCAVYPVRPMACRRFIVFETPCAPGEDPTQTRPKHVLQPGQECLQAALRLTLPWYSEHYSLPAQPSAADAQAFFRSVTTVLQAVPWAHYA
jgi:Fe-S-cluster containining protein